MFNENDETLRKLAGYTPNTIRKEPYTILDHSISGGVTYLETDEGPIPLLVFGKHNLSNLSGAKWICQLMGVDEDDFFQAISTFKGASKRLELLSNGKTSYLFKDFAHAPSKVKATTKAVKEQFPDFKLVACLELHTYSSLDPSFIDHYRNSLDKADLPIVFYDPEALIIKNRTPISPEEIIKAFDLPELTVFKEPQKLKDHLFGTGLSSKSFVDDEFGELWRIGLANANIQIISLLKIWNNFCLYED